jgi:hypothetical protein
LLLPAVQKVREAAAVMQSSNNTKQIGLAMQNYDSLQGRLPPQAICDENGKKLLSWRVAILPYIEQGMLYNRFKLNEPWDSPNNKALIAQMPKVYSNPSRDPNEMTQGLTRFKVFAGNNTAFAMTDENDRIPFTSKWSIASLAASKRGISNTILCMEAGDPVTWTKPDDFDYDPMQPLPNLKSIYTRGAMVLMGDGSVRTIRSSVREPALRAAIDPNSNSMESIE